MAYSYEEIPMMELKKDDWFWNSEKGEWVQPVINEDGNMYFREKDIKMVLVRRQSDCIRANEKEPIGFEQFCEIYRIGRELFNTKKYPFDIGAIEIAKEFYKEYTNKYKSI